MYSPPNGFRFRRSIKIAPGGRTNLSNSGVSTTVGARGAHITFGHGKVRETVGIPGSGLSYSEQHPAQGVRGGASLVIFLFAVLAVVVFLAA